MLLSTLGCALGMKWHCFGSQNFEDTACSIGVGTRGAQGAHAPPTFWLAHTHILYMYTAMHSSRLVPPQNLTASSTTACR